MSILRWRRLCCLLPATLLGCSVLVDSKLDDKARPADAAVEGPVRLDATTKPPRIEAMMSPDRVYPDDKILLEVRVFNLKLVPLDQPPGDNSGFYAVAFVGEGEMGPIEVPLFNGASKGPEFRLDQFQPLVDAMPMPGPSALVVALHRSDGSRIGEEATIRLPFQLCIPGMPSDGCEDVGPPPAPDCSPQNGCDPCAALYEPAGAPCPACLHPVCTGTAAGCLQFVKIDPVLVPTGTPVKVRIEMDSLGSAGWSWHLALVHGTGESPVITPLATSLIEPEVTVDLPPDLLPDQPVVLLTAVPVKPSGEQLKDAAACWPLILIDATSPEPAPSTP